MLHKLPKDHPLWPVIYMACGAGCICVVMFASATDLKDFSEVRTTVFGSVLTAGVGWIAKRMFTL